jgi:acetyl esterase/lipase
MTTKTIVKKNLFSAAFALLLLTALTTTTVIAQNNPQLATDAPRAALSPVPAPMDVPKPGSVTDGPYAPQPILPGGIVIPLFPPDSHYLNTNRIKEAEVYNMDRAVPGRISSIVNIHNPSIEVHLVDGNFNTGAAVILAAGGGHNTLNVGGESADFVPFFFNYGINTVILRNRLRRDGYNPKTDEVYDAQQAIRLVRAHAAEWHIDPNKIGIMGFSAGAELATSAAISFNDFDQKNNDPSDPLAGITSRPDFVGIIYPGPSPFTHGATPAIPRNTPPAFITCAGWGDQGHAMWANEYFTAMLNAGVPNVEMHIYARGHHPGDRVGSGEPPSTGGLTDRGFIAYGTWPNRFIDWFRDLGFFQKPGIETQAAKDVETFMKQPPPSNDKGRGNRGGTNAPANPFGRAP